MTILLVILILVALIIVHELGHFILAKISRVKVTEFGVGYPPRALTFGKIGATEYTLNWIPFGGFVRLFGDEGQDERGKGSFVDAGSMRQALILLAGVAMNVAAALALFTGAFSLGIARPADAAKTPGNGVRLLIADVVAGSPAETAGIHSGDQLFDMSDQSGVHPLSLSPKDVAAFVADRGGKKIDVTYVRTSATTTVGVIPANAVIPGAGGRAGVGIDLVLVTSTPAPLAESWHLALGATWRSFTGVGENLLSMLKNLVVGRGNLSGIVGPVGLVSAVGDASHAGLADVLALAGFISINLAVINLFPIPLLDGGRLVIVLAEAIRGRSISKAMIHALNTLSIIAIVLLMITVTYHDVLRLIS